jgi:hypothetical protein
VKPFILSVDPGELSGVCLVRREPMELIESDELDWVETARFIDAKLREYGGENVDVVCERFIITVQTAKNSQQGISLELIGIVRFLALVHKAGAITLQSSADAKKFCTNPRLKQVGLWHVGGEGHALDALRHALLRLVNTGWSDERLLLK